MSENSYAVEIQEVYKNYVPPIPVAAIVDRLIKGIPNRYLSGLKSIVLRDIDSLNYNRRRSTTHSRKRKVKIVKCKGLYHEKSRKGPAWIEIFVDNLITSCPKILLHLTIFREVAISKVLFHEIGHHIHKTQSPVYKEREDVAEYWDKRLSRHYYRRKYWYLFPILRCVYLVVRLVLGIEKRIKLTNRSS